jgi:AcrR family transcriptional regulator
MPRKITKLKDIEATAIQLIAARGLAQVTIKQISQNARCAEGTLYRHYKSKEEMAWILFKREVEKFGAQLRGILEGTSSFERKIRMSIELFYRFFDDDPTTFSFILLTQHDFPPEWKIDTRFNPDSLVVDFIKRGISNRYFRKQDPILGAAMVLGLVLQPATLCAKKKLRGPLLKRAAEIEKACLKVLTDINKEK